MAEPIVVLSFPGTIRDVGGRIVVDGRDLLDEVRNAWGGKNQSGVITVQLILTPQTATVANPGPLPQQVQ